MLLGLLLFQEIKWREWIFRYHKPFYSIRGFKFSQLCSWEICCSRICGPVAGWLQWFGRNCLTFKIRKLFTYLRSAFWKNELFNLKFPRSLIMILQEMRSLVSLTNHPTSARPFLLLPEIRPLMLQFQQIKIMTPICRQRNKGNVYENFSNHQNADVPRQGSISTSDNTRKESVKGGSQGNESYVDDPTNSTSAQKQNQRCLNWRLIGSESLSPEVNRPQHETDYLPPSIAELKGTDRLRP